MIRILTMIAKVAAISLITGAVLSRLDLSAEYVLAQMGLTPENVLNILQKSVAWAVPNMVLGAMIILPIWFLIYLIRPPRAD